MRFRTLIDILAREHRRRFGDLPSGPWHGQRGWLWEPWVKEFLRTYEAPTLAAARRATP